MTAHPRLLQTVIDSVGDRAELDVQHERAIALGATLVLDRSADPREALRVYSDPAGHMFCLLVGAAGFD